MPTLENPVEQLAPLVSQLYELAGNSNIPDNQRQTLLLQAHDLRGDLVTLVSLQFTSNTPAYQGAMTNLGKVTTALEQAQNDIQKIVGVVNGLGQLASSIDALLKEAVQLGAAV